MASPPADRLRSLLKRKGIVRPRDLAARGIERRTLAELTASGIVEQRARGLYALADAEVSEHHSLALAAKRVPAGVICLLSALGYHDLTTQAPHQVWLAIEPHARSPTGDYPALRIIRMRQDILRRGVTEKTIDGVPVKITVVAKTLADCFKFRNKIGLDVALEALREYRHSRHWNPEELWKYARLCRVTNVLRPYLEAIG